MSEETALEVPGALKQMLEELGPCLKTAPLALDEEGGVTLKTNSVEIHIQYNAVQDRLLLFADLGVIPEDASPELMAKMLKANLNWGETRGATLSLLEEAGENRGVLTKEFSWTEMHASQLADEMEEFATTKQYWTSNIEGKGEPTNDTPPSQEHGFQSWA